MFGIGMPEMLLILAIALIVIGPKKLPDLAKSIGRAMGEFKKATGEIKQSMEANADFREVKDSFNEIKDDIKESISLDTIDSYQPQTNLPSEGATSPSSEFTEKKNHDTAKNMDTLKQAFDDIETTHQETDAEPELSADEHDSRTENGLEDPEEDERG